MGSQLTKLDIPGVGNGWMVDDVIWRSAQPADSAWLPLAKSGVRAVIDLNSSRSQSVIQAQLVTSCGMLYRPQFWNGVLPPSSDKVQEAINIIEDLYAKQGRTPILIKCQHGSDRTGTLCACWRMYHDKWNFEDAMEEAYLGLGMDGVHEPWMTIAALEYAHRLGRL